MATYTYNQQGDLSCSELFSWIAVDKTLDQLGVDDVGAVVAILIGQPVIPTRGKFKAATKGTSVASCDDKESGRICRADRSGSRLEEDAEDLLVKLFEHFGIDRGDFEFTRYFPPEGSLFTFRWKHEAEAVPLTVGMLLKAASSGVWETARVES